MLTLAANPKRLKGKRRVRWNRVSRQRYAGQYFDAESGLHYNYFRTYEPLSGRYLESDPIGLRGGINTFGFGFANPLRYQDPHGLDPTTTYDGSVVPIGFSPREYLNTLLEALGFPVLAVQAGAELASSYNDMLNDQTINADKYFHCVGSCEASRAGGRLAACVLGDAREEAQDFFNHHDEDRFLDEAANATGRDGASAQGSCQQVCSRFLVPGINPRYQPN